MSTTAKDAMGGFDTFIAEQKKLPGEARVTLSQFDDQYETVYSGKPLADVPHLSLVPRGMTALYDAVGRTLDTQAKRIHDEKWADKVIVVIVTDGGENASKEYRHERIKEMIAHAEKNGWSFVYLAANVDPVATAMALGINTLSAMNMATGYVANAAGTRSMYAGMSNTVANLRQGGTAQP